MRVGIVTNFTNTNYGSVLQAVAMQKVIRSMGCLPVHIIWDRTPQHTGALRKHAQFIYDATVGRRLHTWRLLRYEFARFRQKRIVQSAEVKYGALPEISDQYDAFICGSDQIWAPNQFDPAFFLDFVRDSTKKIAYAPSIGLPEIPAELQDRYRVLIASIPHRSIREDQGAALITALTGIQVPVVLDPTLLLSQTEWMSVSSVIRDAKPEKYILCYFLGNNPRHCQAAEDLAKRLSCRLVRAVIHTDKPCHFTAVDNKFLSPGSFLSYIAGSEGVVTDSFHGTIFSIVFQKPFWVFERFSSDDPLCQNSRISSMLGKFKIESHIIPFDTTFIKTTTYAIDYSRVEAYLKTLRERSLQFLSQSLQEVRRS